MHRPFCVWFLSALFYFKVQEQWFEFISSIRSYSQSLHVCNYSVPRNLLNKETVSWETHHTHYHTAVNRIQADLTQTTNVNSQSHIYNINNQKTKIWNSLKRKEKNIRLNKYNRIIVKSPWKYIINICRTFKREISCVQAL